MKLKTLFPVVFLFLCLLSPVAVAGSAGEEVYSHSRVLDDLTYTNTISYSSSGSRVETHLLETAAQGRVYPIVMACDTIYGGMTLPAMVSYAASQGYNVVGAVNSDYFHTNSIPIGLVVEDGVYKSAPDNNNAVGFMEDGGAYFSQRPQITITLENLGGAQASDPMAPDNRGQSVSFSRYNKPRTNANGLYLLNSYFSTVSTRTTGPGWMVRLKVISGEISLGGQMELEVTELYQGAEAQPIGEGYFILTAGDESYLAADFAKFAVGDRVRLQVDCSDMELAKARWATGVGDVLIDGGRLTDSAGWTLSTAGKNPRTALGIRRDGSMVALVADGRQSNHSVGLTFDELAQDLLDLGCVYGVNMDGGGSSTMGLRSIGGNYAPVINSPSDGSPRRCATYILFVTGQKPSGQARTLGLAQDGALVYVGASLPLTYTAADRALLPVAAPANITATASRGQIASGRFVAGNSPGQADIRLSSAGASGQASLRVVNTITGLKVRSGGKELTSLTLEIGDSAQLEGVATLWGRSVAMDPDSFSYTVEDLGTVTDQGLFTAASFGVSQINVSAGGASATIALRVRASFADSKGHWAETYINTLADRGIVGGVTPTNFAPESGIKRGDFMLMLYRAAGQPATAGQSPFSDVDPASYYHQAIAWAASQGIAQGTGDGRFLPETQLNREQGLTFLYRALSQLKVSYSDGDISLLEQFEDAGDLSEYAQIPAATLLEMGVVEGSGNNLRPLSPLTRCQMAKLLCVTLGYD